MPQQQFPCRFLMHYTSPDVIRRRIPVTVGLSRLLLWVGLGWAALIGCAAPESPPSWTWQLPPGFSPPPVPTDNPMTSAKVELGRYLFYDKRLSSDGTVSCSSCHFQKYAFADGKATPQGMGGVSIPRNAQGLSNVAYFSTYTWANPVLQALEQQALVPLFIDFPPELHLGSNPSVVLKRLAQLPLYTPLFAKAFPNSPILQRISVEHIVQSLASFQRSLISGNSPYDRYRQGDKSALSASEQRGLQLFESSNLGCRRCHSGLWFTRAVPAHLDSTATTESRVPGDQFQNTGLYNLGSQGLYPAPNVGLFEFTQHPQDMGKFRIPSLRNVGVTAPYMHDGSISTLQDVIAHYTRGGRQIHSGPFQSDGSLNPHKSEHIKGFVITPQEVDDLVAFLHSLTDQTFLTDPRFSDPFSP